MIGQAPRRASRRAWQSRTFRSRASCRSVRKAPPAKDPHGRSGAPVPLVLITYAATEAAIRAAVERIAGDGLIAEPPQVIRIERE